MSTSHEGCGTRYVETVQQGMMYYTGVHHSLLILAFNNFEMFGKYHLNYYYQIDIQIYNIWDRLLGLE